MSLTTTKLSTQIHGLKVTNNLRSLRINAGFNTIAGIADAVGVTRAAMQQFECSVNFPSLLTLAKICQVLGCSLDDAYRFEPVNPPSK